jgi:hypothetical protein
LPRCYLLRVVVVVAALYEMKPPGSRRYGAELAATLSSYFEIM